MKICVVRSGANPGKPDRFFPPNYLIRAPLNDHLSHRPRRRASHENRSGPLDLFCLFIFNSSPVRRGGSHRGRLSIATTGGGVLATVKREILYRVSARLRSVRRRIIVDNWAKRGGRGEVNHPSRLRVKIQIKTYAIVYVNIVYVNIFLKYMKYI